MAPASQTAGLFRTVRYRTAAFVALALFLIVGGWAVTRGAVAGDASGWAVAELSGAAFARPANLEDAPWHSLARGAPIADGSLVRTDASGRLTLSNGSDLIHLAANSEIELPGGSDNGFTRVIHWIGSAFFEVGKRPAPHFEVDTPYLVATVKGTKFRTDVSEEGASVEVSEGVVGVSAGKGGDERDVTAGQAANVSASEPDKVAPGRSAQGTNDSDAPSSDIEDQGQPPGGTDNPDKAEGNGDESGYGNGNGGAEGDAGGHGAGNAGGGSHGNGGDNGGHDNGCHGNAGCHHDDHDDDDDAHGNDHGQDRD